MKLAPINPMKFAGGLRALAKSAIALATGLALAVGLCATPTYAADKAAEAAEATAKAMAAAPDIITSAKINCDLASARIIGPTDTDVNGTKTKATLYEIACKTGPGFIITAVTPTQPKEPFNCVYLTKIKAIQADAPTCTLPENVPEYKWLNPVAQPFLPGCEVSQARLIGSTSVDPLIDRYEIGCKAGVGGLIDYPQLTATGTPEFKSCLILDGTKSACTFTTKAQIIESMKPIAAAANANCVVNDVRFVGITKESDGFYYEFGCATPPGFMVLTGNDGAYKRSIPCASALGLGGCKFTDAGVAAADANSQMSATLKAAGYPCTVKDFNMLGTQESTKRDYIEFKCPEQPFGLIGFVPQPGSDSMARVGDCFLDQVGRKACTMVTPADLMKQIDKLIKIAKPDKGCDVKEVRYIGESQGVEGGVIAEIACVNKRGYIIVINGDRQSLVDAVPCSIAKSHKDDQQCTIAGNGTYAAAE